MAMLEMERSKDEVIDLLNRIVELELAGAVRYTQIRS
jgi:hypothetical protein